MEEKTFVELSSWGGGVHVIMSDVYFFFFAAGLAWLTVFCTSARSISLPARGIKRGKERGGFSRKCMVPGHTPICGWYGNASPYLQYYSRHGAVLTLSRCLSDFLTYTPHVLYVTSLGATVHCRYNTNIRNWGLKLP